MHSFYICLRSKKSYRKGKEYELMPGCQFKNKETIVVQSQKVQV